MVGWGCKENTLKAKIFAADKKLPFYRLEDGFISYLNHPSVDARRLSLIIDDEGIYYDASSPSHLENLLVNSKEWMTVDLRFRAKTLIQDITNYGITKYNHMPSALPNWLEEEPSESLILVIDQTVGDASVALGQADAAAFNQMLKSALDEHPNKKVLVKTHPDVVKGIKKGYLESIDELGSGDSNRCLLVSDNYPMHLLMEKVEQVYTVTSQMGFEALLYGKRVNVFGMPFYAGWGLTNDRSHCLRRKNANVDLETLVAAALIQYPIYLHPESGLKCEIEDILSWLMLQRKHESSSVDICYAVGFSFWKRSFVSVFVGRRARQVIFLKDIDKLLLKKNLLKKCSILVWGVNNESQLSQIQQLSDIPIWRMEDGFIRSVGLGADLRRPSCLVIDCQGMYFDPSRPSDIINLLNQYEHSDAKEKEAKELLHCIKHYSVTKYNLGGYLEASEYLEKAQGREIILVPGQYEMDRSVQCSRGSIKSNFGLLKQVKQDYPNAYLIYKEHPDLYTGVRPGALGEQKALEIADAYITHVDMHELLNICDRVCTMTSLSGFEALVRGKKVSVYGSPFYAGWGLTEDYLKFPERQVALTIEALIWVVLREYCSFVNWDTRLLTSAELVIKVITLERSKSKLDAVNLRSKWLSRQVRKMMYFIDSFFP